VDGRFQGNFRGKVFGIWCNQPAKDGERVNHWVHAAVALHNIENAWDYENEGDFYHNEQLLSYPRACDVFGAPEDARFVREESRLLARNVTLHELGHAVLRLARHPEGSCRDIVDPGGTPSQSIMDSSCLYNSEMEDEISIPFDWSPRPPDYSRSHTRENRVVVGEPPPRHRMSLPAARGPMTPKALQAVPYKRIWVRVF
jgi:hypothetical protein